MVLPLSPLHLGSLLATHHCTGSRGHLLVTKQSWSLQHCSTAALWTLALLTLPSSAVSGPKHGVSTVVAAGSQGSGAGHRDASATSLQPPVQSSGSGEGRRGWRQSI